MRYMDSSFHPGAIKALEQFLQEDLGYGDITSQALDIGGSARARIFPKKSCILSGGEEAVAIFRMVGIEAEQKGQDGTMLAADDTAMDIRGDASGILAGERLALNLISRMSGIATLTHKLVEKCRKINPSVRVACTRKTTPGFRYFEKRAVMAGGGDPHRWGLDDAVLIKDNHLAMMPSVTEAVRRAKDISFTKKVEIEVEDHSSAIEAAGAGADVVMLDNFSPEAASVTYGKLKEEYPNVIVEVSGGIDPGNIERYASVADVISLGWLTHSVKAVDFSLEMKRV